MEFYKKIIFLFLVGIVFADDCSQSTGILTGSETIKCTTTFQGEELSISLKMDTCRKKPEFTININDVFKQTFDASEEVPVPGMSAGSLAGLYLNVEIQSHTNGDTRLKMSLHIKVIVNVASVTIIDQSIGKSSCNGFYYWWNSQSIGVQVGVGGGSGLFFIILLVCCCKCCCCSNKNRRDQTTIVMAPRQPAANTVVVNNTQHHQIQMAPPPPYAANGGQDPYGVPYKKL